MCYRRAFKVTIQSSQIPSSPSAVRVTPKRMFEKERFISITKDATRAVPKMKNVQNESPYGSTLYITNRCIMSMYHKFPPEGEKCSKGISYNELLP